MFGNMMGKLQEMKQQMDEVKARLDTITVSAEAGNGNVTATATGNRKIKQIKLNDSCMTMDKEELEDYLTLALNKALEQAEKVNEAEIAKVAQGMAPGLSGLGLFGK